MVQANTMAHAMETGFGVSSFLTGGVAVVLVGVVTLGGIKRIAVTAERIVPAMALFYVLASLIVLALNISAVPAAFSAIFQYAFTPAAPTGGFAGAGVLMAVRYGVARGIFSCGGGRDCPLLGEFHVKGVPELQMRVPLVTIGDDVLAEPQPV